MKNHRGSYCCVAEISQLPQCWTYLMSSAEMPPLKTLSVVHNNLLELAEDLPRNIDK